MTRGVVFRCVRTSRVIRMREGAISPKNQMLLVPLANALSIFPRIDRCTKNQVHYLSRAIISSFYGLFFYNHSQNGYKIARCLAFVHFYRRLFRIPIKASSPHWTSIEQIISYVFRSIVTVKAVKNSSWKITLPNTSKKWYLSGRKILLELHPEWRRSFFFCSFLGG